ncbi:aldehyde:ferredoxin oxidoreductase [miscellaneous Crenarchaeota group-1 archaeon SG8-32-3]|uniref:Aldehyde:ferredoxin oxidoreductase n=1 Tax=miscellaneous Crenarchaeota group-1 archaeon SG8-32-3 TaxID=1685125 RepID=A0A0M0BS98_9ARCH|nr:MAG: aldehyde:ferredoxin oxidoreductase [miscellaneous Crenarchaeota group-1 archaeon SG8-32-3]
MFGWTGNFLQVDLTRNKAVAEPYDSHLALSLIGGRGFAAKILWDKLTPGIDPLSPENKLVFAAGPLTGLGVPNSGKLVIAAKSPLTGGYGDGNLGTSAGIEMRKAGYDAVIIKGKAEKPVVLHIKNKVAEFVDAKDFWGLNTFDTENHLKAIYGRSAGVVSIGPAGENLVKFAIISSQEGRAGGRAGMGAVMGSKNLKAVVFEGFDDVPVAYPEDLKELNAAGYREIMTKPSYAFWKQQGTMSTVEWCQENSALPTFNFSEGVFEKADKIGGFAMEKIKVGNRGCPNCNMMCGNVVKNSNRNESEIDYENVAMLGSNVGLGNLRQVAALNRLADELGLDTISLGNVIGFAIETSQKKSIPEELQWGKYKETRDLINDIAYRRGFGKLLGEGVKATAANIGHESADWAMQIKGLEVSAYDCHAAPAMALAYATSSVGAHHKEAWVISWEVKFGRKSYSEEKINKVIEMQRIRGGIFESLAVCRFPNTSLGFELDWYTKYLQAATGKEMPFNALIYVADKTLNLIRAFWIREYGNSWRREMEIPPMKWFKKPLTTGPLKGAMLDLAKFDGMLKKYYAKRGWDERGIPRRSTLQKLSLPDVAKQLENYVTMSD